MKSMIAIIALSFVGVAFALPLELGFNSDLIKDDLNSWRRDFVLGGQRVQIGLGWKKDGTVAAGGKVIAAIDGQEFPLSAAVSTNMKAKEPMKQLKYEVGTQLFEKVAAVLYGSVDGALKYLLTASNPISKESAVGVALEGDHTKLKTVSAGVSYGPETVEAVVGLGDDYKPETFNVQVAGDPAYLK